MRVSTPKILAEEQIHDGIISYVSNLKNKIKITPEVNSCSAGQTSADWQHCDDSRGDLHVKDTQLPVFVSSLDNNVESRSIGQCSLKSKCHKRLHVQMDSNTEAKKRYSHSNISYFDNNINGDSMYDFINDSGSDYHYSNKLYMDDYNYKSEDFVDQHKQFKMKDPFYDNFYEYDVSSKYKHYCNSTSSSKHIPTIYESGLTNHRQPVLKDPNCNNEFIGSSSYGHLVKSNHIFESPSRKRKRKMTHLQDAIVEIVTRKKKKSDHKRDKHKHKSPKLKSAKDENNIKKPKKDKKIKSEEKKFKRSSKKKHKHKKENHEKSIFKDKKKDKKKNKKKDKKRDKKKHKKSKFVKGDQPLDSSIESRKSEPEVNNVQLTDDQNNEENFIPRMNKHSDNADNEDDSSLCHDLQDLMSYNQKQKALERISHNYDKHVSVSKICSRVREKFKVVKKAIKTSESSFEKIPTNDTSDVHELYKISVGKSNLDLREDDETTSTTSISSPQSSGVIQAEPVIYSNAKDANSSDLDEEDDVSGDLSIEVSDDCNEEGESNSNISVQEINGNQGQEANMDGLTTLQCPKTTELITEPISTTTNIRTHDAMNSLHETNIRTHDAMNSLHETNFIVTHIIEKLVSDCVDRSSSASSFHQYDSINSVGSEDSYPADNFMNGEVEGMNYIDHIIRNNFENSQYSNFKHEFGCISTNHNTYSSENIDFDSNHINFNERNVSDQMNMECDNEIPGPLIVNSLLVDLINFILDEEGVVGRMDEVKGASNDSKCMALNDDDEFNNMVKIESLNYIGNSGSLGSHDGNNKKELGNCEHINSTKQTVNTNDSIDNNIHNGDTSTKECMSNTNSTTFLSANNTNHNNNTNTSSTVGAWPNIDMTKVKPVIPRMRPSKTCFDVVISEISKSFIASGKLIKNNSNDESDDNNESKLGDADEDIVDRDSLSSASSNDEDDDNGVLNETVDDITDEEDDYYAADDRYAIKKDKTTSKKKSSKGKKRIHSKEKSKKKNVKVKSKVRDVGYHVKDGHVKDGHVKDGHVKDGHVKDGHVKERKHKLKMKKVKARARSRSFSVSRTFDEEKGVWREKRIIRKSRVPLLTSSQKSELRNAAMKAAAESGDIGKYIKSFRVSIQHMDKQKKVDALTNFCKNLARKGSVYETSDSEDEREKMMMMMSDAEDQVGCPNIIDRQAPIKMNIKDSKPLPILNTKDKQIRDMVLMQQFPISSGILHHERNKGWVPVEKPTRYVELEESASLPSPSSSSMVTIPSKPLTQAAVAAIQIAYAQNGLIVPTPDVPDSTKGPLTAPGAFMHKRSNYVLDAYQPVDDFQKELSEYKALIARQEAEKQQEEMNNIEMSPQFSAICPKPSILGIRSRLLRYLDPKGIQQNNFLNSGFHVRFQNPMTCSGFDGLNSIQKIIQTSTFETMQRLSCTALPPPQLSTPTPHISTAPYTPPPANTKLLMSLMRMQHPNSQLPETKGSAYFTQGGTLEGNGQQLNMTQEQLTNIKNKLKPPSVFKKPELDHKNYFAMSNPISHEQLVASGPHSEVGRVLLMKMGWKEGGQLGIGSANQGLLKPIEVTMKSDRKGLQTEEERTCMISSGQRLIYKGHHPVSFLNIMCIRRRWPLPKFQLVDEGGPQHMKYFLYKVKVNGVDYQPTVSSCNKKSARAEAALSCLQALDCS